MHPSLSDHEALYDPSAHRRPPPKYGRRAPHPRGGETFRRQRRSLLACRDASCGQRMPVSHMMFARTVSFAVTRTVRGVQRGNTPFGTTTSVYVPATTSRRYVPSEREWVAATTARPARTSTRATIGRGGHGWPTRSTGQVGPALTRPATIPWGAESSWRARGDAAARAEDQRHRCDPRATRQPRGRA